LIPQHCGVIVGRDNDFEDCDIWFSPGDRTGCPAGKNCGVYVKEQANIWKCVNHKKNCYPIGDSAYNLSFSLFNASDPVAGVMATYGGGASSFVTNVRFLCDEKGSPGEMNVDEVAIQRQTSLKTVNLRVSTLNVCPGYWPSPTADTKKTKIALSIGLSVGLMAVAVSVIIAAVLLRKRKKNVDRALMDGVVEKLWT
jgi:hypothetical protein